jgi:hypothetical protein
MDFRRYQQRVGDGLQVIEGQAQLDLADSLPLVA